MKTLFVLVSILLVYSSCRITKKTKVKNQESSTIQLASKEKSSDIKIPEEEKSRNLHQNTRPKKTKNKKKKKVKKTTGSEVVQKESKLEKISKFLNSITKEDSEALLKNVNGVYDDFEKGVKLLNTIESAYQGDGKSRDEIFELVMGLVESSSLVSGPYGPFVALGAKYIKNFYNENYKTKQEPKKQSQEMEKLNQIANMLYDMSYKLDYLTYKTVQQNTLAKDLKENQISNIFTRLDISLQYLAVLSDPFKEDESNENEEEQEVQKTKSVDELLQDLDTYELENNNEREQKIAMFMEVAGNSTGDLLIMLNMIKTPKTMMSVEIGSNYLEEMEKQHLKLTDLKSLYSFLLLKISELTIVHSAWYYLKNKHVFDYSIYNKELKDSAEQFKNLIENVICNEKELNKKIEQHIKILYTDKSTANAEDIFKHVEDTYGDCGYRFSVTVFDKPDKDEMYDYYSQIAKDNNIVIELQRNSQNKIIMVTFAKPEAILKSNDETLLERMKNLIKEDFIYGDLGPKTENKQFPFTYLRSSSYDPSKNKNFTTSIPFKDIEAYKFYKKKNYCKSFINNLRSYSDQEIDGKYIRTGFYQLVCVNEKIGKNNENFFYSNYPNESKIELVLEDDENKKVFLAISGLDIKKPFVDSYNYRVELKKYLDELGKVEGKSWNWSFLGKKRLNLKKKKRI